MFQGQGRAIKQSQDRRCRVKLCSWAATAWSSSRDRMFMARHVYHGMTCLPSNNKTHDNFVYGMINCWPQIPGSSPVTTGIMSYLITNYPFCQNPTLLSGVICRVKGVICRVKCIIMRNWATTHFQFRNSRFFRYDTGHKPWAHTTRTIKLNDPVLNSLTLGPWLPHSPLFGFMDFLVLPCFALFHPILATCSSHTGMSCMLFSRWLGASSRHQHLQHRNHNLEQNYLDKIKLRDDLSRTLLLLKKLPGEFFISRGCNFVPLAKGHKFGTGRFCRYV